VQDRSPSPLLPTPVEIRDGHEQGQVLWVSGIHGDGLAQALITAERPRARLQLHLHGKNDMRKYILV
jgi:hypothetical protein